MERASSCPILGGLTQANRPPEIPGQFTVPIANGLGKAGRTSLGWRIVAYLLIALWLGLAGNRLFLSHGSPFEVEFQRDGEGLVKGFGISRSPISLSLEATGVEGTIASFADKRGVVYSVDVAGGGTRAELVPEARWLFRDGTLVVAAPGRLYLLLGGWNMLGFATVTALLWAAWGEGMEGRTMMLKTE